MLTVRGFPRYASHAQWWPRQWMATQCDCEVIVPEDGSTIQNYVHIFRFYLKLDAAKVAHAFFPQYFYIYWLFCLKFIFKTWAERGKKHNCLAWKAAVTDNCNGKYLTQPPDLNSTTRKEKKKKKPNQDASVRLPETAKGRTTEVRGSQEELDDISNFAFSCMTQRFGRHLPASSVCLSCTQMASLKYPIWSWS